MRNMNHKLSLIFLLAIILSIFTGCVTNTLYSSEYLQDLQSEESSEKALDYLFTKILLGIEQEKKEEILDIVKHKDAYATIKKNVVMVTNKQSNIMLNISTEGIHFSIAYEFPSDVKVDYNLTMYLIGVPEDLIMELNDDITISSGTHPNGIDYCIGYLRNVQLPDGWNDYLASFGDGGYYSEVLWFSFPNDFWVAKLYRHNDSVLRIAYLVNQYFKRCSDAKTTVTDFITNNSNNQQILLGIKSGRFVFFYTEEKDKMKANNIVLELENGICRLYLHDKLSSQGICYANVICDGNAFWLYDAQMFVSEGEIDYPLNDQDLIRKLSLCQKCSIEYYDSMFNVIQTKTICSDDDLLLLQFFINL